MKSKTDKNIITVIGEAVTSFVAIGLIVTSFILPPTGIIDNSVLKAVGEILIFPVVWMIPDAIRAGRTIKYKDLEISSDKKVNYCYLDINLLKNLNNKIKGSYVLRIKDNKFVLYYNFRKGRVVFRKKQHTFLRNFQLCKKWL